MCHYVDTTYTYACGHRVVDRATIQCANVPGAARSCPDPTPLPGVVFGSTRRRTDCHDCEEAARLAAKLEDEEQAEEGAEEEVKG
jgi:hypothetical protein